MRKEALVVAAALLVVCAAPAQAESKNWFSFNGGYAMPKGPFKDRGKNGVAFEADMRHMLMPQFGVGMSIAYADFQAADYINTSVESVYGPGSTLVFTDWSYTGFVILAVPVGRVTTYGRWGGGVYNPKLQIRSPLYGIGETTGHEYGYLAGGGVNLKLTDRLGLGVDGTWHGYDDSFWGFNMSWWNARVSVLYQIPGMNDALQIH
jgi:hypothetical protein